MPRAADPAYLPVLTRARQVMATYADMEELIRLGAYRPAPAPRSTRRSGCTSRWRRFSPRVRKKQPVLAEGYQRLEQILGRCGNRKLTLSCHTRRWSRSAPVAAVAMPALRRPVLGGFGGVRVDEVTRDAHSPEEISGRREAAQGRADRGHDRRVRAHGRRSRARDQDRAGPRRHPRSRRISPIRPTPRPRCSRRENLKRSADELKGQLDDAKAALGEAFEELKKVELLDERDQMRERAAENAARAGRARRHRPDAGAGGSRTRPESLRA